MLSTPPVGIVPLIQEQDPDDHLHPEYPVCRRPDPCCRDQEGAIYSRCWMSLTELAPDGE